MKPTSFKSSDASPPFSPEGPVDWALGTAFVESLLKPILYSVLPDRLDPRDWMTGERAAVEFRARPSDSSGMREDYWFDFVADTGDSDVAMYSLAYLFHGDLALVKPQDDFAADEPELSGETEVAAATGMEAGLLPRGDFLFIGGDTAYPVAEQAEIDTRFTAPLNHAFTRRFGESTPPARPLFGIPGNHDWYDSLDGFNRLFRKPVAGSIQASGDTPAPTRPRGYVACQQASYFTLELPGDWQLWALDARDGGDVDFRQKAFFEEESAKRPPQRLILATPNPPFVDGERADFTDELFANLPDTARAAARLWFSGDTHHYARYAKAKLPGGKRLTTLVSGLGGAALHAPLPGGLAAMKVYPTISEAARAVLLRLAWPPYMLARVGLRRLGLILGFVLGAGCLSPSGEVSSWLRVLLEAKASPELPLVLGALIATIATIVWKVVPSRRRTEFEARGLPVTRRVRGMSVGALLVAFSLVLIAHGAKRSFGSVLLDVGFELACFLLVGGVGAFFYLGLGPRRSVGRVVALLLVTLALAGLTVVGSVVAALVCKNLLASIDWPGLVAFRFLLAGGAAGLAMYVAFPVLAGWALVPAFLLGTGRAFVSSFAAVDRFQAFIRFRLRVDKTTERSSLTGFVIAVTEPVTPQRLSATDAPNAPIPKAEIIDVFTIR